MGACAFLTIGLASNSKMSQLGFFLLAIMLSMTVYFGFLFFIGEFKSDSQRTNIGKSWRERALLLNFKK
jgi:hypothetical protein